MAAILLNGKPADVNEGETLRDFLRARRPGAENLVVEWNGKILTAAEPLAWQA